MAQLLDGAAGLVALALVAPSAFDERGVSVFFGFAIWWGDTDARRWQARATLPWWWRGLAVRAGAFGVVVLALAVIGGPWPADARVLALFGAGVATWLVGLAVDRAAAARAAR